MSTNDNYSFLFIGAGKATYFEFAGIQVVFKNTPNKEQKEQIEKCVPPPIGDELYWDENIVSASSHQFAHVDIANTYPTKDGFGPEDEKTWSEDRWFFAADSQVDAFNNDIERWLHQIHRISPVLLAFRREDSESGGTEFSDWHRWSLKKINSILPFFDPVIEEFEYDTNQSYVLRSILYFIPKEQLETQYREYLYPGETEVQAFLEGDIEPLEAIKEQKTTYIDKSIEGLNRQLDTSQEAHRKVAIKYLDVFLSFKNKLSPKIFEELCDKLWYCTYKEGDKGLMDKIPKSKSLGDTIGCEAWQALTVAEFEESRELYTTILLHGDGANDLGVYANVLYVLQKDNTGLPIDKALNHKMINICLKVAPKNPLIFFNACCLYVEMEEYDKAYQMVEEAIKHKYKDIGSMKNQIENLDMFVPFRKKTKVLELF